MCLALKVFLSDWILDVKFYVVGKAALGFSNIMFGFGSLLRETVS